MSSSTSTTAGARLRRAVKYPSEDSDTDPSTSNRPELDEQQQEEVIEELAKYDAETIAGYRKALLGLTLLALMFVNLRSKFDAHPFHSAFCLLALALSFLSAYDIYVPPISTTPTTSSSTTQPDTEAPIANSFGSIDIPAMFNRGIEAGGLGAPILRLLRDGTEIAKKSAGVVNPLLCVVLVLGALRSGEEWEELLLTTAPVVVVCAVLVVAKRWLKPVGLAELEGLKYGYKGA